MTYQNLDLNNYDLQILSDSELSDLHGGHWLNTLWKAFEALTTADAVNDAVNGLKDGFKAGYNKGSGGHGASGTW
jgi:hypothetical protein